MFGDLTEERAIPGRGGKGVDKMNVNVNWVQNCRTCISTWIDGRKGQG